MLRLIGRRLVPAVAALVALVLAHDLAFLARYGSAYGEALAHAGHGPAWTAAVAGSVTLGVGLLLVGLAGLVRLRLRARRLGAKPVRDEPRAGALVRRWWSGALWLAATTATALTVQENLERVSSGIAGPDIGLLVSREYPLALPIVIGVAAAVALVVAMLGWRRDVLEIRVRLARRRLEHAGPSPRQAATGRLRPAAVIRGRRAVRAPPRFTDHLSPA